jgi:hypothetical protein
MRVINEVHSLMASVRSRADESLTADPSTPVIRLTGFALMADVNIVVRRNEAMRDEDWDEDDD